jgi:CRP/FNR family transcriptional regulator
MTAPAAPSIRAKPRLIPIRNGADPAILFAYPRRDALFGQLVTRLVGAVRSEALLLRTARRQLRAQYPNADLNRQREVIVRDVPTEAWFAYREGRHRPQLSDTRWWDRRGTARGVVDGTGRITHPNPSLRSLLQVGAPPRALLTTSAFVSPDVVTVLSAPTPQIPPIREIDSTATVHRRTGGNVDAEFHLAYDGAGPGRHALALRSYADRDAAIERAAIAASSLALIGSAQQRAILRSATRRDLPAGIHLPESLTGDGWATLVVAGIVRTYLSADGAEPTLLYGSRGRLLGTHTVASDGSMPLGLQTVTPSRLLLLNAEWVADLGRTDHQFARAVTHEAIDMIRSVVSAHATHSTASLEQRLARELVILASMRPNDMLVSVTEQQLADGVGSIRESVGRTIATFRSRGWIATTRNGVIVLDVDGLRSIGDGGHS